MRAGQNTLAGCLGGIIGLVDFAAHTGLSSQLRDMLEEVDQQTQVSIDSSQQGESLPAFIAVITHRLTND